MEDKLPAYEELYRVLSPGKTMTVVNGWTNAPLIERSRCFMGRVRRLHDWWQRKIKKQDAPAPTEEAAVHAPNEVEEQPKKGPAGTFVQKLNAEWLTQALEGLMPFEILVWRSVSVAFLRSVIYPEWAGRFWLKVLYSLEEIFPRWLGRIGQYPLVVISKPQAGDSPADARV
jgi:hypothetical protein